MNVLTHVGTGVLDGHVDLLKRKIETDGDGAEESQMSGGNENTKRRRRRRRP